MPQDELRDISIVIPAYNEAQRLPSFLERLIYYCKLKKEKKIEIIVVDDGSSDSTGVDALGFKAIFPELQVLRLDRNMGAGFATKRGFLSARGEIIVSMDADGSVSPEQIEKCLPYLHSHDLVIGSRALKEEGQVIKIKFLRKIISVIFNYLVRLILSIKIRDTQCGFMMLKREKVHPLFLKMRLNRFGSYIEALYIAGQLGYRVKEVPISWEHKEGTKVRWVSDSLQMFLNLFQIKCWHSKYGKRGIL